MFPQCFVIYSGEAHFKEKTDADTVNADKTHDRLRTNLLTIFTQLHLKGRPGILSLIPGFARMRFSVNAAAPLTTKRSGQVTNFCDRPSKDLLGNI